MSKSRATSCQKRRKIMLLLTALTENLVRIDFEMGEIGGAMVCAYNIVEFARQHWCITSGEVIKLTGEGRNTLKIHFITRSYLSQHGSGLGVLY